jgi:hypothetical protein
MRWIHWLPAFFAWAGENLAAVVLGLCLGGHQTRVEQTIQLLGEALHSPGVESCVEAIVERLLEDGRLDMLPSAKSATFEPSWLENLLELAPVRAVAPTIVSAVVGVMAVWHDSGVPGDRTWTAASTRASVQR